VACWALTCGQYLALVSAVTPRRSPALPASITKGRVQPQEHQQQQQPLLLTATPGSHVSSLARGSVGATTFVNGDHTRPRHHHDVDLEYAYATLGVSANVYPFVGTGTQLYTSTTGPGGGGTTLYYPLAITGDASGNLYILEIKGSLKFVEYSSWTVTTVLNAGSFTVSDSSNWNPRSMAYDKVNSILYIAATGDHKIVQYKKAIGTSLGTRTELSISELAYPTGVALDSSQNLYIVNRQYENVIKYVSGTKTIVDYFGKSTVGITLDSSDNLYVTVPADYVVYKRTASTGITSVFAGTKGTQCSASPCGNGGAATSAFLYLPGAPVDLSSFGDDYYPALGVDSSDNIYLADYGGNSVRVISSSVSARCDSFRLLTCTCSYF
jgi:hypothetical protein